MSTTHTPRAAALVERGFTLLEVLIAMLVMSIGLLGIGKLMILSARANDSAYMRTQATALGYTILDAMRANRQAALVQGYDTAMGVFPGPVACTAAAPCNSGQQAQSDLNLWGTNLGAALPQGQGSVTTVTAPDVVTGANNVTATVTVQWSDKVAEQSFGAPAGNLISITLETVL
ncbi:MAG TPA: type IV pilus modification protein PilV [Steroidobacteraceae bacterium]|jgi:type IV pilus assembly protein PilV|nr:type IV pilus modification protein PilV [Steroidobacteraceae bacterium]